jgi:hypothetical protein
VGLEEGICSFVSSTATGATASSTVLVLVVLVFFAIAKFIYLTKIKER